MTYCFFSAQYLPTLGGVENYTYNLTQVLAARGEKIIIVTSALPDLPSYEKTDQTIEIFRLPVLSLLNCRFPILLPTRSFFQLTKAIWSQRIDRCVINTRFYCSSLYAATQCRKRRIPALIIEHSTGHLTLQSSFLNRIGHLYEHIICRWIYRNVPDFYGVSQKVCTWLNHFKISAAGVLYNAISPEEIEREKKETEKRPSWRKRLGLSPDVMLLLFASRLIPEKGILLLLSAFEKIQEKRPDKEEPILLIAGTGALEENLKKQYAQNDKVYFLGPLPHSEIIELLSEVQLCCLPTFYAEGFPSILLEAAACGCPILTSRTGGSHELLPTREDGWELPSLTEQAIIEDLEEILTRPELRCQAAERTRQRVFTKFTWDQTCNALEAAFSKIVK